MSSMLDSDIVVKVNNISKIYKLYKKPFDRVKEAFHPLKKKYHKRFYALDNVSFELRRGEALGIIGRNGNGKSTLLKIIAKVLTPTSGNIVTKGKVSAILELTSNLKPEMTGRENIIYNLKLQGFNSKKDIAIKSKEIEEFAEIGDFIEQPVKLYSSGMRSRLGFGIATSTEPDILILDEVLAVGDFNFQQKCLAKINSMRDKISMIFVSHSMNSVRLFCDNVMVLEKGKKAFYGKAEDGIKYYLEQEEKKKLELKKKEIKQEIKPFYGDIFHNKDKITDILYYWADDKLNKIDKCSTFDNINVVIKFKLLYSPKKLIIGIPIWNENGNFITGISTDMKNFKIKKLNNNNEYQVICKFKNIFNPNKYISIISIYDGAEALCRLLNNELTVINTDRRYFGFISLEHEWKNNIEKKTSKKFKFNDILLNVDSNDPGGLQYDSKSSYEELNSKLYLDIKKRYNPDIVIDIGANYGFTGLVFKKIFNKAKIILVEPSPKLTKFIKTNFEMNQINVNDYEIIQAICAEKSNIDRYFSLNPKASQDNRVIGENENWKQILCSTISCNDIISRNQGSFYFIKIDTQGYEKMVLEGCYKFLNESNNWIIKTEFAPYWLKSQGTEPKDFLKLLIDKYNVSEIPTRTKYKDSFHEILKNKLKLDEIEDFIKYTENHNKNKRGWCDLLITPKTLIK